MSIKVFLADDHRLMVEGFRIELQKYGIDVVKTAYSLNNLIPLFNQSLADVLVVDIRFDSKDGEAIDGLDLCEKILTQHPSTKIVVFSQFDDEYLVEKAYKIGVCAFVRKDEETEVLVEAITSAYNGKAFLPPGVAQQLAWASVKALNPARLLDDKEIKVFKLIADGLSIADVAQQLELSDKTIRTMVKNIKQKLNIDNVADFTKLAIRFGLISLEIKKKN